MSTAGAPLGIIHGRFQPFHNEHLTYLRLAAARSEELVVGITNPEPDATLLEPTDADRHRPEQNPYGYWQRLLMIEAVLESEGVTGRVVPFPISEPAKLHHYVPPGGVHYLRVFDAWGEQKVQRLQSHGYEVVVLESGAEKTLTGSDVRTAMRDGAPWRELVPAPVARVLERLHDEADSRRSA